MKITTIGLDIAKSIFHLFAVDYRGKLVQKKILRRKKMTRYFAQLPACTIVMESCGSSHHWARVLKKLGHEVKLIAPQYVKPYIKGNKNDFNDAEGIAEAAQRPNMRFVPIKTIEQQDVQLIHTRRASLIKQRTALSNQIRGQLAEYGLVMKKSINSIRAELPYLLEDAENGLTACARAYFDTLYQELVILDKKCKEIDKQLKSISASKEVCRRLEKLMGIGPIIATAFFYALGDACALKSGRHLSAWLGIVPKQHSSGGKDNLLGISKRGNSYLRTLLIHGARSALKASATKTDKVSRWANSLKERRGFNIACVALANKMARIVWVLMARNEEYKLAN